MRDHLFLSRILSNQNTKPAVQTERKQKALTRRKLAVREYRRKKMRTLFLFCYFHFPKMKVVFSSIEYNFFLFKFISFCNEDLMTTRDPLISFSILYSIIFLNFLGSQT
jgi:hypothetical protein